MILPDDTPASPSKLDPTQLPANASAPSGPSAVSHPQPQQQPEIIPPPAYTGPASYYQQPQQQYQPHAPLLHPVPRPPHQPNSRDHKLTGESPGKRFIKALFVAILVWVLTGMLFGAIIDVSRSQHRWVVRVDTDIRETWPLQRVWQHLPSGPQPEDGQIVSCVEGDAWRSEHGIPSASFELPLSAERLYFFNRGVMLSGNVTIIQDPALKPNDHVVVDISVYKAWDHELLDHLKVCALHRPDQKRWGVAIYTPNASKHHGIDWTMFEVHIAIRIPPAGSGYMLYIPQLRAVLPNFSYQLGDLARGLQFGELSLQGSNARITVGSVAAESMTLQTTGNPIIGDFSANRSISLITTNANIEGTVSLTAKDEDSQSSLKVQTSNGHINTSVQLESHGTTGKGGDFDIFGLTTNAPLRIAVSKAPMYSDLDLTAVTSNAPANVNLPRAFEGRFKVIASGAIPHLSYDDRSEDPTGKGRKRTVWTKGSGHRLDGYATWGPANEDDGSRGTGKVTVDTTNGPAFLKLL